MSMGKGGNNFNRLISTGSNNSQQYRGSVGGRNELGNHNKTLDNHNDDYDNEEEEIFD